MSVAAVTPSGADAQQPPDSSGVGLRRSWDVSPERQRAIFETIQDLLPRAGRMSPAQLRAAAARIASRRELWADLVVHDPDVRRYLPLYWSQACDVWLLSWLRGQDTDWHDHGGSSGSFGVADGNLIEHCRVASGRRLTRRRVGTGEAVAFGPGHVHDVAHGGEGPATSIHVYSPLLTVMTYYQPSDYRLIASETVVIDGPDGARGRGRPATALAGATALTADLAVGAPADCSTKAQRCPLLSSTACEQRDTGRPPARVPRSQALRTLCGDPGRPAAVRDSDDGSAMTQELMQDPMDPTGRHLRIVSEKPGPDLAAAERAAEDFLTALGVDLGGDGLAQTPARMARAYAELFDAMTSAR